MVPSTRSEGHYFIWVMQDLGVATTSLAPAIAGTPYTATLQVSNAEIGWPLGWDITQGSLPLGLTLSEDGVISGTPAGADSQTFTVRVREPFRRFGERRLTIVVGARLAASSGSLRAGEVGVRYAAALRATGGAAPLAWAVADGTLPSGLRLNTSTGAIRGVPQAAGRFALTFTVTDSVGQRATVQKTIRVAGRLAVTTARLPSATAGEAYSARLTTSGGLAPKRWSIVRGSLPPGVKLDRATGALSGVPRTAGAYRITVRATDRLGASSTKTLRIVVG